VTLYPPAPAVAAVQSTCASCATPTPGSPRLPCFSLLYFPISGSVSTPAWKLRSSLATPPPTPTPRRMGSRRKSRPPRRLSQSLVRVYQNMQLRVSSANNKQADSDCCPVRFLLLSSPGLLLTQLFPGGRPIYPPRSIPFGPSRRERSSRLWDPSILTGSRMTAHTPNGRRTQTPVTRRMG
jgi:hypothetical protein